MIALDKELNYYSGYFNGIQDIYNHKSCKEVGKGILKLVSLISVIAPIFVLLKSMKIQSKLDELRKLNAKVSTEIEGNRGKTLASMEIVRYLVASLQDDRAGEELFGKGFKLLDSNSQKEFFAHMSKTNNLERALNHIPKDVASLAFRPGPCSFSFFPFDCADRPEESINIFAKGLGNFEKVVEVEFDLSEITCLSKRVLGMFNECVTMSKTFRVFSSYDGHSVEILDNNSGLWNEHRMHSHCLAAQYAIQKSTSYLKTNNQNAKISFKFKSTDQVVNLFMMGSEVCFEQIKKS